jgi:hypothetical protein
MDRRTWFQLISILAAARPGYAQQRGQQPGPKGAPPMRVTKDQVTAALKLLGLEFQDAEIDQMLRRVNGSLFSFEAVRKIRSEEHTSELQSPLQ